MAAGLWPRLQCHPEQGQLADCHDRPQRGRGELRVPIPAAQLLEDPGKYPRQIHSIVRCLTDSTGHFQGQRHGPVWY
jgi:hypothetical protein